MTRRKKEKVATLAAPVLSYKHKDKRKRIPTQEESVELTPKQKQPVKTRYEYDPSLDPRLEWTGKTEAGSDFSVSAVPIYVQEKVAPEAIISRLKQGVEKKVQYTLFEKTAQEQFDKAISFYEHEDNWQNRMILGDSLLVMNSLLEKEGLRGRVQTIFVDPPYGIKFGSNWQVSTRKRDVKENKLDDFVRQPEQVKAFRDTWVLGIHSYLHYLRDRLMVARELLTESGSCYVQINDQNVHLLRCVMDEVFGSENFISQIPFVTTSGFASTYIDSIADYIVWYGKDQKILKYRQLFKEKTLRANGAKGYDYVELANGQEVPISNYKNLDELPSGARIFAKSDLLSKGASKQDQTFEFKGKDYSPNLNSHWKAKYPEGMKRLAELNRIIVTGKTLRYKRYFDDFKFYPLGNVWTEQLSEQNKQYVVQTSTEVIRRCILMSSDTGDLILDPTCGSGTTAFVAEKWGRRWITIDTSRVALALARTRLMGAKYPHYCLKDNEQIRSGFEYEEAVHVTLKSLANNEEPTKEVLLDQPHEVKGVVRVTGPFTVESLSPHSVSDAKELESSDRFIETVRENILAAGVQTGIKNARIEFINLEIIPSGPEVQLVGEYETGDGIEKVAVAIGPEFGSVDDDFVRDAANCAKRFATLLIIAATSFEAAALSEPSQVNGLRVMKVKINPDLSMGDLLKKTKSGNLFMVFGEPEIEIATTKRGIIVEIKGVDVYDPVKGEIRTSGTGNIENDIATWFIDDNYNGKAFFVTQAYFLGGQKPYEKLKKALKADIDEELWNELYSSKSRPFAKPKTGKIAIKVINHYGDEVMKVVEVK